MHCATKKRIFCLCTENVMHVFHTFFQIKSWCWKVRNRRQKVINSRTFRVWRTAWHSENLIKTPVIDIVGAMFGGGQPTKLPVATRLCGCGIINGSFCATESYEQSLVYDFTVCLECSFCNHEDQNSNKIKQACWVQILSSTSSPAQKTWQWLSHLLHTVSLLAQWTSPLCFQRSPQPMAEIEVWAKGQNVNERGPLATEGEEKSREVIVNPDMDVYTETRNHRKTLRKT